MSLKIEFVERASKPGANKSALCREFGITRETGHKWMRRFAQRGYAGLEDESRRPSRSPTASAEDVIIAVLKVREEHPSWGPKKLVVLLQKRLKAHEVPSRTTVARILKRFGCIRRRRRKSPISLVERAPEIVATAPNEVWTIDFKGWWLARDGGRCEPLTVRDGFSRFVLGATLVAANTVEDVKREVDRLFRRYGVPEAIQCDNGTPFISVQSRGGLTRLSAWWVSLGITMCRSRPGCPQDNGGHERMHRDLKAAVDGRPRLGRDAEQRALDRWRQEFNHVRPHEALGGKTPAETYRPGTRRPLRPRPWSYRSGWHVRRATAPNGRIRLDYQELHVGRALVGQPIGIEPLADGRGRLWFRDVDLGVVDLEPSTALIDATCVTFMSKTKRTQTTKRAA